MKSKMIFRVVAVAITLSILMLASPVSPALAAPAISAAPTSGPVGSTVTAQGLDFTAFQTVHLFFGNTWVQQAVADGSGDVYFAAFTVPINATPGLNVISVMSAPIYSPFWLLASTNYTVLGVEAVTLTPTSGFIGDTVTISGSGFSATKSVTITFDDVSVTTSPASVTTDATGAFSGVTFTIPVSANGDHIVKAEDADNNSATATFTVGEEMSITPTSGFIGDTVTISGIGFSASKSVTITFDDVSVTTSPASVTTNSTGGFTAALTVPASANGDHTIKAEDADNNSATATFTVGEEITVTPTSGFAGDTVTVSGNGFAASSNVTIYFDSTNVGTAITDASGTFSGVTFTVPVSAGGSHTIKAQDSAGNFDTGSFTIGEGMNFSPTSGLSGSTVTVSGSGFAASSSVTIYFDATSVGTAPTDASGTFSGATFTVPVSAGGSHTIKAQDSAGNSATGSFTVLEEMTVNPTSGLVGSTVTVSGGGFAAGSSVTIYFDDASLTSVTASSTGSFSATFTLPASARGSHTIKAQDSAGNSATGSFVTLEKINVNPTSGFSGDTVTVSGSGFAASSSVTIYFDGSSLTSVTASSTGSFTATFTVPSSANGSHTIKAQDSAGNFATGNFATLEKINVTPASGLSGDTVTVSGNGFAANSSVIIYFDGTSVGTTITTSSGTFSQTTFSVPSSANGSHTIRAQDSAGNSATGSFIIGEGISVNPTSGFVGDTVTVSGSGFAAGSSVTIYFDSTSVGTTITTSGGTFSQATFTVPSSANGSHTIKAQDSAGNSATGSFTIGEGISVNPTSGFSGDTVTVSGRGFGGNKSIDIYLDNILIAGGTATAGADGNFTATLTIPASASGSHTIKAQDSDGNSATATLTVMQKMAITPTTGVLGTIVSVNGTGFGATKTITIKYNNVPVSTNPATLSTDASGSFSGSFSLPASPAGSYAVEVSDGTLSGSANFVAVVSAGISKTTSASSPGYVGMELTISGDGFKANATVTVTYTSEPTTFTTTTDSQGSFSVAITIPSSAGGAHTISATDGETTRQFAFVMEQQAPPPPQLLLPVVGDKLKQPLRFDWADVSDDSPPLTYTLQIATDQNFTTLVLDKPGLSVSEYTLAAAEELESVKKDAPYYWRVQAVDGASNASLWTADGSFHIGFVWPSMPDWVKYLLIGLGVLVVVVIGFWLGMRTAYSSF